jgi:cobalt-zinc-cadmium efflux system membrane fusion protein
MMTNMRWFAGGLLASVLAVAGCGENKPAQSTGAAAQGSGVKDESATWWCGDHRVPEHMCALCDPELEKDFKAKGDWCKEHKCPDSQCFVCHPEKEAYFVALYEAKFKKKPPKGGHGHDHPHNKDEKEHKHDEQEKK